jgi:hypothetical protein
MNAFTHPTSTTCWQYYVLTTGNFDDWVRHGLPHLLVLHNLDTHTSYWVHVTAKAIQVTRKGCQDPGPRTSDDR